MIRVQLFNPITEQIEVGGAELIERWSADESLKIWVDLQDNPVDSERCFLEETFGLHPLAIEDAQRQRHPPKLERFDEVVFLLLKGLDAQSDSLDFGTIQLAIFVAQRFIITRHSSNSISTDALWAKVGASGKLWSKGAFALALDLIRLVVDRYLDILLDLEPRLDQLEDEIQVQPKDTLLHELSDYRTRLKKMRRYLIYQVQLFGVLKESADYSIDKSLDHDIVDIYERLERASSLSSLYTELVTDLMESYISLASHHLNNIMKILTVVTVIFVPLTFMAGIYGMNFEHMPELHYKNGYYALLGMMILVALSLLIIFRKVKWL
ncbi:MAG: magnesium/cobalt transporter CorA [Methyloprofundus sp.]|nr:magnesium/cobalt transporter CorA [Methyloprofundus sp.]MBW6452834.1 magnesium/cobalt transporter CorA [Methyloprofundus sp.]